MFLLEILKIMLIIDLISFIGLCILLHSEIIEMIKEQRLENKKNKQERNEFRKRMTLNEFGGWNYDI